MARKNTLWCDPALLERDLSGKTYIVTGANSGVGLETTRQLVKQGAHVVMACRRVEAGEEVAREFAGLNGTHEVQRCDLADLQSVRAFVAGFLAHHDRLDGLSANAGAIILGSDARYTSDGLEMTMAASYFGHVLMIELLLDMLKASAPSRIGFLSSVGHAGSPSNRFDIHFEDLNWKTRTYGATTAYCEAKLAVVLYAKELAERLQGTGVSIASIHPGWARSNFGSGGGFFFRTVLAISRPLTRFMTDTNWASAQTSLHVFLDDDVPNHSGAYYSQSSVLYRDRQCKNGGWPMQSPNPNANDMDKARRLVEATHELIGLDQQAAA